MKSVRVLTYKDDRLFPFVRKLLEFFVQRVSEGPNWVGRVLEVFRIPVVYSNVKNSRQKLAHSRVYIARIIPVASSLRTYLYCSSEALAAGVA